MSSLEASKQHGWALEHKVSLPWQGGKEMVFKVPLNPNNSVV